MSRRLKRSVHWYSWPEYVQKNAAHDVQSELVGYLRRQAERGWKPAGRVQLTIYTDGAGEVAMPFRAAKALKTEIIRLPASELRS